MKKINKNIIILFLIVLFLSMAVFAVVNHVYNFTSGNVEETITFITADNYTIYIDIPRYSYVQNITVNIEGVSS